MTNAPLAPLVDLLKTLAHPGRLRILALLRTGELCVCQITEILGIPASTASEHLTELRRAGLLQERRDGRWVHYRLRERPEPVVEALWPHLDGLEQVALDRAAATEVRRIPLAVTCSKTGSCATLKDGVHAR